MDFKFNSCCFSVSFMKITLSIGWVQMIGSGFYSVFLGYLLLQGSQHDSEISISGVVNTTVLTLFLTALILACIASALLVIGVGIKKKIKYLFPFGILQVVALVAISLLVIFIVLFTNKYISGAGNISEAQMNNIKRVLQPQIAAGCIVLVIVSVILVLFQLAFNLMTGN